MGTKAFRGRNGYPVRPSRGPDSTDCLVLEILSEGRALGRPGTAKNRVPIISGKNSCVRTEDFLRADLVDWSRNETSDSPVYVVLAERATHPFFCLPIFLSAPRLEGEAALSQWRRNLQLLPLLRLTLSPQVAPAGTHLRGSAQGLGCGEKSSGTKISLSRETSKGPSRSGIIASRWEAGEELPVGSLHARSLSTVRSMEISVPVTASRSRSPDH